LAGYKESISNASPHPSVDGLPGSVLSITRDYGGLAIVDSHETSLPSADRLFNRAQPVAPLHACHFHFSRIHVDFHI
jgi:hypothetical protein